MICSNNVFLNQMLDLQMQVKEIFVIYDLHVSSAILLCIVSWCGISTRS